MENLKKSLTDAFFMKVTLWKALTETVSLYIIGRCKNYLIDTRKQERSIVRSGSSTGKQKLQDENFAFCFCVFLCPKAAKNAFCYSKLIFVKKL